jgi:diguanylate cyclase (GGDEF)-like protein
MTRERILVVEDEPMMRDTVLRLLERRGYLCRQAADGDEVMTAATSWAPDLVLMDVVMARRSGLDALGDLRSDYRTRFIPVIMLTARAELSERVATLLAGADDYVLKPYVADELFARIHVALSRAQTLRDINPLTGLPGNRVIRDEIDGRLERGESFDVVYADLNHFKAFNDAYGFARGDAVIAAVGRVLSHALQTVAEEPRFIGHIGGDDFVMLVPPGAGQRVAQDVIDVFDSVAPSLHDKADRDHGYLTVATRSGVKQLPMASISVAVVPVSPERALSSLELGEIAAEVKALAKQKGPASAWAIDRRTAPAMARTTSRTLDGDARKDQSADR